MDRMCEHFVRMLARGYGIVLTHGNGPVVGNILFRMAKTALELPPMPMDVCVAHSQGGIGYITSLDCAFEALQGRAGTRIAH